MSALYTAINGSTMNNPSIRTTYNVASIETARVSVGVKDGT
jgi:hypothetical protein